MCVEDREGVGGCAAKCYGGDDWRRWLNLESSGSAVMHESQAACFGWHRMGGEGAKRGVGVG